MDEVINRELDRVGEYRATLFMTALFTKFQIWQEEAGR